MAAEIVSRSDAKARGLPRYYTGNVCKNSHIAERRTINGICIDCDRDIQARCREKNPDRFRAKWKRASARARALNPERVNRNNRKWASANPDKVKAKKKRWRSSNLEHSRESEKRWRDANPDKIKKKNRSYKTANAERLAPIARKRTEQWRIENPDKVRENGRKASHTRRARQYEAGGSYTNAQIQDLLEKQKWKCAGHGCTVSLRESKELDHIVALARGGSNGITNLQWLCPPCNRKKRDKDPIDWAREHGKLL